MSKKRDNSKNAAHRRRRIIVQGPPPPPGSAQASRTEAFTTSVAPMPSPRLAGGDHEPRTSFAHLSARALSTFAAEYLSFLTGRYVDDYTDAENVREFLDTLEMSPDEFETYATRVLQRDHHQGRDLGGPELTAGEAYNLVRMALALACRDSSDSTDPGHPDAQRATTKSLQVAAARQGFL